MTEKTEKYYNDILGGLAERTIKRLWIALMVTIFLLCVSNAFWIWRETQFVDEQITISQENDSGYNNYVGNDGDIYNGYTDNYDS